MIVLFVILQTYLGEHERETYIEDSIQEQLVKTTTVELSENRMILVNKITEHRIIGYDIKNKISFNKSLKDTIKVSDAYGKIMPLTQIKTGDIVEVDYQSNKDYVVAINKTVEVKNFKKISGVTVDEVTQQIRIGGINYTYMDKIMVLNKEGLEVPIEKIGPFDIVTIQMLKDMVWSIIIDEEAASLNMVDLPTQNGQIEIDHSRLILFKDITEPIKVIPGVHKIVIKMEGYVPISEELNLSSGENYELSLQNAEIAYTTIIPSMSAKLEDYTIRVGSHTYKPGEEMVLQQGLYEVEVLAEGYERWIRQVNLSKDIYQLSIALTPIEVEEESEALVEENGADAEEADTSQSIDQSRTIVLNTDPVGAKVYINGTFSGETPYTVTLNNGTYTVLFEKTGYEVYSTNILLDGSNDQSNFLYALSMSE